MRRFAGACRFVFNRALARQNENHEAGNKYIPYGKMASWLVEWKNATETQWLIFNGFFEEFIFHRFLAEQALEFFNLLHGGSKFRGRNNLFSGGDSSKTSFLVLLTPEK